MTGALYAVSMTGDGVEKYRQIADDLRADILSGKYAPEDQLPSLAKLKAQYGVSDGPVNQAMRVLRDEGLVRTEQGSGSFALKPPEPEPSEFEVLMREISEIRGDVRQLKERTAALEKARQDETL